MIGTSAGKVLAYSVRSRNANSVTKKPAKTTIVTTVEKNWTSSLKAMESDMAVSMLHNLKKKQRISRDG